MTEFEADCLYEDIKRDASAIRDSSEKGCEKAKRVIELHRMCVVSADVPTVTLLGCAYKDWVKENAGEER